MGLIKFLIFVYCINLYAQSIDIQLLKKADEYFKNREYYKAKNIYENLIQSPDIKERDRVLFNLGKCYSALQQKEKMYNTLNMLLTEYPDSKYISLSIPLITDYLKSKRKYKEAIEILEKYIKKYPEILKKRLLELYEYSEEYEKALNYLEENFKISKWYIEKKVKYLRNLKRFSEAVSFLKSIIEEFKNPQYYQMLAELYIENGDLISAERYLRRAYDISNNIHYIIEIGRMYALHNQIQNAIKNWGKLFTILGRKRFVYEQISNLYKEFGLYKELLKLYDEAKRYGIDFTKEKISVLEIMGRYEEAVDEYINLLGSDKFLYVKERLIRLAVIEDEFNVVEKVLKRRISRAEIFLKEKLTQILYYIYYETNKIKKAEDLLKEYVNLKNIDIYFINKFIDDFLLKKEYKRLYNVLKNMKRKDELTENINLKYATLLYHIKRYKESLAILQKLDKRDVNTKQVDYLKSLIYFKTGKYESCIRILEKCKEDFRCFLLLVDSLAYSGRIDKALKYIGKGMKEKRYRKDILYFKEAILLLFLDKSGEAKSDFKKLVEVYPNSEYANEVLLYLFIWDNEFVKNNKEREKAFYEFIKKYYLTRYKEASELLKRVAVSNTTLEEIVNYLSARCYFLAGDSVNALNILDSLIQKESIVLPYALELAGDIYYRQNRKDKALNIYKRLIDKYPNHPEIQQIRERIIEIEM